MDLAAITTARLCVQKLASRDGNRADLELCFVNGTENPEISLYRAVHWPTNNEAFMRFGNIAEALRFLEEVVERCDLLFRQF